MCTQIPDTAYIICAAAYFTSFTKNTISFLFEDSDAKRQLALLNCLVKGLACHSCYMVAMGWTPITFTPYGIL